MEVSKVTEVIIKTSSGDRINEGDVVVFECAGKSYCGKYRGLSKKGALKFEAILSGEKVTFNVLPRSVEKIYKSQIVVNGGVASADGSK